MARGQNIVAYSRSQDGNTRLTQNFTVKEFACNDGSDPIFIDKNLPKVLQKIRDKYKKALVINSAYRTAAYNKHIGGAERSFHTYGMAADFYIAGVDTRDLANAAREALSACRLHGGGVGMYKSFVHVDTRWESYLWDNTSGKEIKVNGF